MNVGRIVGTVVSTRKDPKLEGLKLLVVDQTDLMGQSKKQYVVAIDAVGAGKGDLVLFASGSSARQTEATQNRPVDTVIMSIVDEIEAGGERLYDKAKDRFAN